jgi:hypothetical protein
VQRYVPPQPIIARRHSYQTGTTRFFDVRYVDNTDQALAATAAGGASGTVYLCLSGSQAEADAFAHWAQSEQLQQRRDVVIGVLARTRRIVEVLKEMHCLHWVHDNTPELRDDPVARREIRTRLNDMETLARNELESVLRVHQLHEGAACRWFYLGEGQSHLVQRGLSQWLSQVCDDLYAAGPTVRNEILNRRQLSSQGAAARRNLIEAMLLRGHLPALGIDGYPPERSMYESLLSAGNLHQECADHSWEFGSPPADDPLHLLPVWNAIGDYIFALPPKPRGVQGLFTQLSQPPYGVTDGVLPVLLCAFLIVH